LQGYAQTNFEPGRAFANELDFQGQLDAWFAKANARTHKTLKIRPVDRLADEQLASLPANPRAGRTALEPARRTAGLCLCRVAVLSPP
jgi:hypothetical protein